jgi:sugar phosphate isomerase/epimerase
VPARPDVYDFISPSILLSETHFHFYGVKSVLADALERVADEGFYRGIEMADISDPAERKRIGKIIEENGLALTQWMSMVLITEKLNLSSLDEDLRRKSVARMIDWMPLCAECGTTSFAVLSGPDPGPALRAQTTEQLYRSFIEICEALERYRPLRLLLEPLDRDAHKNFLIGPTDEAASLLRRVKEQYPKAGLSWDTAHSALCEEDVVASMCGYRDCISQMHLANAVLDRSDTRYGDHHMPMGAPGFLTVEKCADLFEAGVKCGFLGENRPGVSVEVRGEKNGDPWDTERGGREFVLAAWNEFALRWKG